METLYGRLQVADSSNQYNPFRPGQAVMDYPCAPAPDGGCYSPLDHHPGTNARYARNPPPERSKYMQFLDDGDVRGRGLTDPRRDAAYLDTIGTGASDIARGQMLLPSAYDMPIVRRAVFFDTRYRDAATQPDAGRVLFELEQPITSVSRIAVVSAKIPIRLTENSGLALDDYVMLSVGVNLPDRVTPANKPDSSQPPTQLSPEPAYARALAYVPLVPDRPGSSYAALPATIPPHVYYTDYLKPIPSIERVELSWHRFQKVSNGAINYVITPAILQPGETPYDVDKNATVLLTFYCKNRRPE